MHISLDEPENLARELAAIAGVMESQARNRAGWKVVAEYAQSMVKALDQANEAPRRE
jgi:hypothetical protein